MNYHFQWGPVWKALPELLPGLIMTLELALLSFVLGALIAFVLALGKSSNNRAARGICVTWIEIARNTPCLFQIYMAYFGLGALGIDLDSFYAVLGAITFNTAGYLAEVIRGGIEGIDQRQYRAGAALGMNRWQTFIRIILPQLVPLILPGAGNQLIWSLLNTSLGMVVGLQELTGATYTAQSLTFRSFEFFIITAVVYYLLAKLVTLALYGAARLYAGKRSIQA
ncbi:amino acid ABC transporter permease [Pseudomonas fluorescens]|uniref:L-cystine transport system permease protein YecS n=1 Tax=Pseudomonas fluorescens TaxID=294 RepID=A0A5E7BDM0_PSEFL|nr:amino acid ABC transporter permease [Pseudomonas fluorescens]VVN90158.1 L-cystine transport system permease protein YecS [Pseudomonas fluorescens]